jgi:hypothetical protein
MHKGLTDKGTAGLSVLGREFLGQPLARLSKKNGCILVELGSARRKNSSITARSAWCRLHCGASVAILRLASACGGNVPHSARAKISAARSTSRPGSARSMVL